jgi:hypothetical protein
MKIAVARFLATHSVKLTMDGRVSFSAQGRARNGHGGRNSRKIGALMILILAPGRFFRGLALPR